MDDIKFELKGADEAAKALSTLNNKDKIRIYQRLNKDAANGVRRILKSNSTNLTFSKNIRIQKSKINPTGYLIGFLKKVFYLFFNEKGTEIRTVKGKKGKYKGANRGKITPKPFVEKSHDEAGKLLQKKFGDEYQKALNNALKKELRKVNNQIKKMGLK